MLKLKRNTVLAASIGLIIRLTENACVFRKYIYFFQIRHCLYALINILLNRVFVKFNEKIAHV